MRRHRQQQRGFILLGVILVISVIVASVMLTLRTSSDTLRQAAGVRSKELVSQALTHGLNAAIGELEGVDPIVFSDPIATATWDIFDNPTPGNGFVPAAMTFPPSGPFQNLVNVRVGLRQGQLTQPPPGEDVRTSYGFIVELQLSADMFQTPNPAEERVAVGVQVPAEFSHSK
jgi:type II secretory pathway pseudopilin PulG